MKDKWMGKLRCGLQPLSKEERNRYLNNYEEIIADKVEDGRTEEEAVAELGGVKEIVKDILGLYDDLEKKSRINELKYVNKGYLISDLIIIAASYLLTLFFYFNTFRGVRVYPEELFYQYIAALLAAAPVYLILYFAFKLYTIKTMQSVSLQIRGILAANIAAILLFGLFFYIMNMIHFSRIFLFLFALLNTAISIAVRFLFYYIANNYNMK